MAIVSVLFSFLQRNYGWTEKYFRNGGSSPMIDTYPRAIALFQKRMQLSGKETEAQYIRISQEGVQGDSLLFAVEAGTIPPNPVYESDTPTTCVLMQLRDATNQWRKNIFIRGIWEKVATLGGRYTPDAEYVSRVNAYIAQLKTDGWGWMASERPATVRNIASIEQVAGGTIKITTSDGTWANDQIGKSINVRLSRVVGSANLNGQLIVVPTSANIAYSLRAIAILPVTPGTGRMRYTTQTLKQVDNGGVTRIGERRTGRPILQPRGRSRIRPRG